MLNNRQAGFTLVELMIVLAIIGILATLVMPQYSAFVQSSRRADAIKSMTRILSQQELFYSNNGSTYTSIVTNLGYPQLGGNNSKTLSEDGHYEIELQGCGAGINDCVLLTAQPAAASPQITDYYCTAMTINSRGQIGFSYNGSKVTPAPEFDCWD